jgi:hypothetical protein
MAMVSASLRKTFRGRSPGRIHPPHRRFPCFGERTDRLNHFCHRGNRSFSDPGSRAIKMPPQALTIVLQIKSPATHISETPSRIREVTGLICEMIQLIREMTSLMCEPTSLIREMT